MTIKDSELFVNKGKIYHLGSRQDQLARNIFVVGDHVIGITASASGFFAPQGREIPDCQ